MQPADFKKDLDFRPDEQPARIIPSQIQPLVYVESLQSSVNLNKLLTPQPAFLFPEHLELEYKQDACDGYRINDDR